MSINELKFKLLLLTLVVSFFSCDKEDSLILNNPEKVRLLKILKYSNSTASKLTGETIYAYDEAGNIVKESFYDCYSTTILERYNEYEYSGNKKTKKKIFDGVAGNPTLGSYIEYFYTGDLLVKEETRSGRGNYGSLVYSMNYEYDVNGNLVREYMYDPKYGIMGDMKYTYDNQNKLILEENTAIDVNDYKYIKYIYDNNGRKIKMEYNNINEELIQYTEIFYNGASKLPEKELNYDKNGTQTVKYQHYYDNLGNLTATVINDECSKFKRKYNGNLLIEEILYWWWEYGYFGTGQMPENGMSRYEYEEL